MIVLQLVAVPVIAFALFTAAYYPRWMPWGVKLWFARRGLWAYRGLRGCHPRRWPTAQVQYDDGCRSVVMAIGNAVEYSRMFHATVVRPY